MTMKDSIIVKDDFCERIDEVRASAFESGFGTWRPNKGEVGTSNYEGMNFWGRHALLLRALSDAIGGKPVFPNNMFFRLTRPETEKAYVHSDRMWGQYTAIVYLSEHSETPGEGAGPTNEVSGTGFYRHRETGLLGMPTFEEMQAAGTFGMFKQDMVSGSEAEWEQTDFVRGHYNRLLMFRAPLFHARCPKNGLGATEETGRLIWACHFEL